MAYRELPLPGRPAPHVACVWTRDPEPVAGTRRILPDACVDVVWVQGDRLAVAGPATGPVLAALPAGAPAAGVRFRVGAAGSALGVPARELRDVNVPLEELWGARAAGRVAARLERAATPAAAAAELAAAAWAELAFPAGYAAQAHLTRGCRRLAGLPPAALLATGAGPAGDRSVALAPADAPDALAA